jgi:hypothetical protein
MVSKLHYAVMEVCQAAAESGAEPVILERLFAHFDEIGVGIGLHKDPKLYGAFPTDPYSHTPWHRGAQQPGMTGQVKEDILVRFGELGVSVQGGALRFEPTLLSKDAFIQESELFELFSIQGKKLQVHLPVNALAFTCCQVPVVYQMADADSTEVHFHDGTTRTIAGLALDIELSREMFTRSGKIQQIVVHLKKARLR